MRTPLCDLLGIRHPVVLAGMAGGPTTPELVAAVSAAGGLGTFGLAGMTPDTVRAAVARAVGLTDAPVAVNILVAPPHPGGGDAGAVAGVLAGYRRELGLPHPPPPPAAPAASPAELAEAGLEAGARVLSIGLGDPGPFAPLARDAGAPLIAMVSSVAEAHRAVEGGADVVVAQGWEAGGHRSTFDLPADGSLPMVGTMALVRQVVLAVDVPVIAAGGIMDGAGLVAALALGAQAAQLGTRFLVAREAGVPPSWREALRGAQDTGTVVTRSLSGRPARGLPNRIVRDLEEVGPPVGWPEQNAATTDVRRTAAEADRGELMSLWAGQAAALSGPDTPAVEIVAQILEEARRVTARLAGGDGPGPR